MKLLFMGSDIILKNVKETEGLKSDHWSWQQGGDFTTVKVDDCGQKSL